MSASYFFFGYGYCARALAARLRADNIPMAASYRTHKPDNITAHPLNDTAALAQAAARATHWLISAPPDEHGCPMARLAQTACMAAAPRWVGYLSTTGVYGDQNGDWVDEQSPTHPTSKRAQARLLAERQWQEMVAASDAALSIFRLAGIYGPSRNPFCALHENRARRIVKEGQVFGRIHVEDIASAILAASARQNAPRARIYNLCDNHSAPPAEPVTYAAKLMGVAPPPLQDWADAQAELSPLARSFYEENRRVRNQRLKDELGVALAYPDYKTGLDALWRTRTWNKPL